MRVVSTAAQNNAENGGPSVWDQFHPNGFQAPKGRGGAVKGGSDVGNIKDTIKEVRADVKYLEQIVLEM